MFKVEFKDADAFAKVWTHKGIVVPMQEPHVQFACDYANIVLKNFIQMIAQQQAAKKKELEAQAKPLVTLE